MIGGGLLGLEAASGLLQRGLDVTVVHIHPHLMEQQLDAQAAELLRGELERRGLKFKMAAEHFAPVAGRLKSPAVGFADGSELPADLVVMAVGVRPNIELARAAGLPCDRGVLVDDTMLTYDPSIYAIGECVQHRGKTFGLVAPLLEQARVCATYLAERGTRGYRAFAAIDAAESDRHRCLLRRQLRTRDRAASRSCCAIRSAASTSGW